MDQVLRTYVAPIRKSTASFLAEGEERAAEILRHGLPWQMVVHMRLDLPGCQGNSRRSKSGLARCDVVDRPRYTASDGHVFKHVAERP